jgi:hypothetical protein
LLATTVAGSRPRYTFAPAAKRSGASLASSTTNEPSSPCGRPTRPTATQRPPRRSVDNLEQPPLAGLRAARAHDRAQRPRHPAVLPDYLADVLPGDMKLEDDGIVALAPYDPDLLLPVDQALREIFQERVRQIPFTFSNRRTDPVGCAPFEIQSRTFSSFTSIVDGSVWGL